MDAKPDTGRAYERLTDLSEHYADGVALGRIVARRESESTLRYMARRARERASEIGTSRYRRAALLGRARACREGLPR